MRQPFSAGSGWRILEISQFPLVASRCPAETTLINKEFSTAPGQELAAKIKAVASQAARLWHAAFGPVCYDLVVCRRLGRFIYRRGLS